MDEQEVVSLLCELFQDESLYLILAGLSQEEKECKGTANSANWNMLKRLRSNKPAFKEFAENLLKTYRHEKTEDILNDLVNDQAKLDHLNSEIIAQQNKSSSNSNDDCPSCLTILSGTWHGMPYESKMSVLSWIGETAQNINSMWGGELTKEAVISKISILAKHGNTFSICLAAIPVAAETLQNVYKWYNGEITSDVAIDNIAKTVYITMAGFYGASSGAFYGGAIGSMVFPGLGTAIGTAFGGAAGAIAARRFANWLINDLKEIIFNLHPMEALGKAYEFLKCQASTACAEISRRFRELLSDIDVKTKEGQKSFTILQIYMSLIRIARGEKTSVYG